MEFDPEDNVVVRFIIAIQVCSIMSKKCWYLKAAKIWKLGAETEPKLSIKEKKKAHWCLYIFKGR